MQRLSFPARSSSSLSSPPTTLSLGDVLQRLAILAPNDLYDLEVLARDCLERAWPQAPPPLKRITKD